MCIAREFIFVVTNVEQLNARHFTCAPFCCIAILLYCYIAAAVKYFNFYNALRESPCTEHGDTHELGQNLIKSILTVRVKSLEFDAGTF
jgi:hypothetical protein